MTQLFPGVKLAIGPPIENGFYYDFHRDVPFTEEDLTRLEERMRDLAKADYPIVREERSRADAIRYYRERGEPFKVEILETLPADVTQVSFYRQGDFVDLCRGPHVPGTGHIQAFKLLSSSGHTGGATSTGPCSSASTGRPGSPRRSSTTTSGAWRRRNGAITGRSAASSTSSCSMTCARGALLASQGYGRVP